MWNNDAYFEGNRWEEYAFCAFKWGSANLYIDRTDRNENDGRFNKIIPILGPCHAQVAFITAISKRFQGSGLSDIFVSVGIIVDMLVDQAMRGKHFRRIVRALQLTWESLTTQDYTNEYR